MKPEPISMYVPARNAERTLVACIEAIRSQTQTPDELFVVVDPRSSDRTVEIAWGCGVEVIEQRGGTLGSARNQAIAAARSQWLACCDSDVILESDWLERLAARRSQKAVGIGGRTNERVRNPFDAWRALHMPHHWGDYPLRNPFMLVSEVLFDRQALLAVGGYRDDLNYYEDSDLCQRLRDAGYDLFYEPAAVAEHQRTDTLSGLLSLRWKYSEFRQAHLMDRFAGLLQKIRINREYALNSLSRSLAREHEELAYISFLLFFHHLQMDLRSLMSRRPMIAPPISDFCERQLVQVIADTLGELHPGLARWISSDLRDGLLPEHEGGADQKPILPPAWETYLNGTRSAIQQLVRELGPRTLSLIDTSARFVHGQAAKESMPHVENCSADMLQAELDTLPIRPFVDEAFCRRLQEHWPRTKNLCILGKLDPREEAGVRSAFPGDSPYATDTIGLIAHLEANAQPLKFYGSVPSNVNRLVVCYQPLPGFVAGLDVPSASDLASSAAAAGWTIEHFDTLVGRIWLLLSRSVRQEATLETATALR